MTSCGDDAANYASVMKYIAERLESNAVLLKERGGPDYLYHKGWGDALRLVRDFAAAVEDTYRRTMDQYGGNPP